MKVKLYLQLENFNDGDFDVRNDYYASDEEFFAAAEAENKKYSNVAYDAVSNLGNLVGNRTAKFNQFRSSSKNVRQNNYMAEATLLDENGKDENVDNLVTNCFSNDVAVYIIKYDRDNMDEEFEEDLKFWTSEHEKISEYKAKIGEDKAWQNEPVRTLYVEFLNNSNETKYARFDNCKILDNDGENEYAILVEKIRLVDNI